MYKVYRYDSFQELEDLLNDISIGQVVNIKYGYVIAIKENMQEETKDCTILGFSIIAIFIFIFGLVVGYSIWGI